MSFTDQKSRIASEQECRAKWGGGKPGERFRCYLCGYKFKVGDVWRWVYGNDGNAGNFMTCQKCDGPDVKEKMIAARKELDTRFWWAIFDCNGCMGYYEQGQLGG